MVRELKFQSVHKSFKGDRIEFHEWGPEYRDGKPRGFSAPCSVTGTELIALRQYTGLHDKHGNEIYEGDIIVHEGEHKVIDFKGGSFGIDHQPTPRKPHERILSSTSWEVIGNIYQNPELI